MKASLDMTYPRSHLVDSDSPGFYHVVSRCVRRSWLCGFDSDSGRSYDHRRDWIEKRIEQLSHLFSVEVYAYAVMSNHYHLVVRLDPTENNRWPEKEVAARWVDIQPPTTAGLIDAVLRQLKINDILDDTNRVSVLRNRLSSLSWFMRFINHPIACIANQEDGCTGHFWESRFKTFALLDEESVIACMAYVDLNPIRANAARNLLESKHTSIRYRLIEGRQQLCPIWSQSTTRGLNITFNQYTAYLSRTGILKDSRAPPDMRTRARVMSMATYQRVFGGADTIASWCRRVGQHWIHGIPLPM